MRAKFHSDALGVDKSYVAYLPAGYDAAPKKRWPVFYYLNGLGGDESNWVDGIHIDAAADALGLDAIIVMPDGDDSFYTDSTAPIDYDQCMKDGTGLFMAGESHSTTCVRHRMYETYIVKDLVAHIDATYRTIAKRDGRAIAGLSMGGLGAWELALRHLDLFAAAASHSGVISLLYAGPHPYVAGKAEIATDVSKWGESVGGIGTWVRSLYGPDIANWKAHDPSVLVQSLAPGKIALYLDCGTEDDFQLDAAAAYVHDLLTARKIEHTYFSGPGHHDAAFWQSRESESLKFLRDHVTAAK